jgi:3D (Asp-Asp-Asp) domain-containing protein
MKNLLSKIVIGFVMLIMVFNLIDLTSNYTFERVDEKVERVEVDSIEVEVKSVGAKVVATVYNAVPAQTNNDPEHTASMFKLDLSNPYKHRIIAVSRDLLIKFPMHTKVKVTGTKYDGIYIVEDKMNKRFENRIDLLINLDMPIGKWENASITIVK